MNNVTEQSFLDAQLAILDLPPVDRKRGILDLALQHGLKNFTHPNPATETHWSEGHVAFPLLNTEVEGYPTSGSKLLHYNGGVHMRKLHKNKPGLYFGNDIGVSTLAGLFDKKFGVKLKTIQASDVDELHESTKVLGFMSNYKYRVSYELTRWDYILVETQNNQELKGSVRQGLRRELRKHEDAIVAEYFAKFFA